MRRSSALFCLFLLAACTPEPDYAPKNIDDTALSPTAHSVLAPYFANAKKGSANANFYLGMTYCGELCLNPRQGTSEAQKAALAEHLADVKHLGIEQDYIRSYAYFLLADDSTSSEESYRKLLEGKMSKKQLESAHLDAGNWKAEAAKPPVVTKTPTKKTKTKSPSKKTAPAAPVK